MWRKQDEPQAPSPPGDVQSTPVTKGPQALTPDQSTSTISPLSSVQTSRLTQLLILKGEITGQDDLLVDGKLDGKIRLQGGRLTIGPDGHVTAEIEAREVIVRGEFKGNIKGHDRVQIAATGKVTGEISTKVISIEEGAEVHLRVNLEKEERPRSTGPVAADLKLDSLKAEVSLTEGVSRVHV